MKLPAFISSFFLVMVLLSSCQKEISGYTPSNNDSTGTDTTPSDNSFRVKRYVEDVSFASDPSQHNIDSFVLTYDNQGRLLSLTSVINTGFKFIYSYSDQSYTMEQFDNNALSIHEDVFLSGKLVDSTSQYNDEGDTTTEKYTYNTSGQVTRINEYDYTKAGGSVPSGTTTYTYDANGDQASETNDDGTITYTYGNKTVNTLDIGLPYYSVPKHLPDALTYTTSGETYTGTHTYKYDSLNRITSDTFALSDGSVAVKRYYY